MHHLCCDPRRDYAVLRVFWVRLATIVTTAKSCWPESSPETWRPMCTGGDWVFMWGEKLGLMAFLLVMVFEK